MQLHAWLTLRDMTDARFAGLVNADRSTISRLRRGKHNASLHLLARIAEVTNGAVTPNDFLCDAANVLTSEAQVGSELGEVAA